MVFAARSDVTTMLANHFKPCEFVAPPPPPGNPPSDVTDDVTQVYLTKRGSLISGKSVTSLFYLLQSYPPVAAVQGGSKAHHKLCQGSSQ